MELTKTYSNPSGICMYSYVFVFICKYLYVFVCGCMYLYIFVRICICTLNPLRSRGGYHSYSPAEPGWVALLSPAQLRQKKERNEMMVRQKFSSQMIPSKKKEKIDQPLCVVYLIYFIYLFMFILSYLLYIVVIFAYLFYLLY